MLRGKLYICLFVIKITLSVNLFAFEIPSVTSKGLGGTVQLSQSDVSGMINNGLSINTKPYGIELGFIRNYQLSDLDEYIFGGYYRYKNSTASFGVSQFGDPDLYTESNVKLTLSHRFKAIQAALSGSVRKYEFNSEFASLSAGNIGFSFCFNHDYFIIGAFFEDILKPELTNLSKQLPATSHLYLELLSDTRYKTTVSLTMYEEFDNRFGFGEEILITDKFSLLAGFCSKPSTLSGGFKISIGSQLMTFAFEQHPVLGFTQGISFTFMQ